MLTKGWKFNTLKIEEDNFRFSAFWIFCDRMPKLILANRQKIKSIQQKNTFVEQKWSQIEKFYKMRGNASMIS